MSGSLLNYVVHPSAVVEDGAVIGDGTVIGPFCRIGRSVKIGRENSLLGFVSITGQTEIGDSNEFFEFSAIGGKTEDLKFRRGAETFVKIGSHNTFREYCTVNSATGDGDATRIGSRNSFLSYSHVAHDCIVHNSVILGCGSKLAGHVELHDFSIVSGLTGVIQFVRVGAYAFVGATNKVTRDILPFAMAEGNPSVIRGVNVVGLTRNGFDATRVRCIRDLFKRLAREQADMKSKLEDLVTEKGAASPDLALIRDFVGSTSQGVAVVGRSK